MVVGHGCFGRMKDGRVLSGRQPGRGQLQKVGLLLRLTMSATKQVTAFGRLQASPSSHVANRSVDLVQ